MRLLKYMFFAAIALSCLFLPLAAAAEEITVAAASDLVFAFKEISTGFERETGAKVVTSFGSSGMLATQIRQGGPFDVFFSADARYVEGLIRDGLLIPDTVAPYARGRLALAVNKSSGFNATGLKDLLRPEVARIALANPAHAPYGRAAVEALKAAGLWEKVKKKVVYGENIRSTLQFVQTGNAQAGIIALSIADVPEITRLTVDESLHAPLLQACGVLKSSGRPETARKFLRYVNGKKGQEILKKYGFSAP